MKRLLFAFSTFFFFFAVLTVRGEDDKIVLHQADAYMGAGTNTWWLSVGRLERLPLWKGRGAPPLSVKKALKIARKWISPKSGDGDVSKILLRPEDESKY